jgi:glutaredoxin 2
MSRTAFCSAERAAIFAARKSAMPHFFDQLAEQRQIILRIRADLEVIYSLHLKS